MDEIYCPLCGKPNPVENTFCEYCLGYLDPGGSEKTGPVPSDPEDIQDEFAEQQPGEDTPEWLYTIQEPGGSEKDPTGDEGLGLELPAADTSGWMPDSTTSDTSTQDDATPVSPFVGSSKSRKTYWNNPP